MSTQKEIARAAGLTQAAVSMALRGDPSIPLATRAKVAEIAERLGYRPNAYVSALMSHIRAGKTPAEKGCIALIVDRKNEAQWMAAGFADTYKEQYRGMQDRAEQLGYRAECFYLQSPGMSLRRIDQILQTRGITSLILTVPWDKEAGMSEFHWERYAVSTIAYSWPLDGLHRASTDHRKNVETAFTQLFKRGYKRPGMVLPPEVFEGANQSWLERFLLIQYHLPPSQRVPIFPGKPGVTPLKRFQSWMDRWQPDSIVCLIGHEMEWINEMVLNVPRDLALVCVNRPPGSAFSGVEENHAFIGATAVDLVVAQMMRNEFGIPEHARLILVEGSWVEGETLGSGSRVPANSKVPKSGR